MSTTDKRESGFDLRSWTKWAAVVVMQVAAYVSRSIRHGWPGLGSTIGNQAAVKVYKTAEKFYRINDEGRVLKRSLRKEEYETSSDGDAIIPRLVVERLKNEAACMTYIAEHTDIPVPKLLEAYEENGSYYLWMEFIDGVRMSDLTAEKQREILPQSKCVMSPSNPFHPLGTPSTCRPFSSS